MPRNAISAQDFLPKIKTMNTLRKAAKNCKGCSLYKDATQTVFGEGSTQAKLIIVGEIAGDKEDQLGKPFVGVSGQEWMKLVLVRLQDLCGFNYCESNTR